MDVDALTDNIRILSEFEICKLQQKHQTTQPIFGTFEYGQIALGNGNKDNKRTEQTVNHETIHETLTELFNEKVSYCFDRLYYCFEPVTKGEFKGLEIHQALTAFFEIETDIFLI